MKASSGTSFLHLRWKVIYGLFFILFSFFGSFASAQQKYWVHFSDKGENVSEQLSGAEKYLSKRSVESKKHKNIPVDFYDLPVVPSYIQCIQSLGYTTLVASKWLNAVVVKSESMNESVVKDRCPCVEEISPVGTLVYTRAALPETQESCNCPLAQIPGKTHVMNYGAAIWQQEMIGLPALHDAGFTGKGVTIAIFDAGFYGADTSGQFSHLWQGGNILASRDFVQSKKSIFKEDDHGANVFSLIGAEVPGKMIGTAPHANFLLARTEIVATESRQEEHNWVKAMEWADSVGVDVIHSSLGYSTFDDAKTSYEYKDLDGNTAIITQAVDIAAKKGILVTTSAGNEANGRWKYITAPCDADSVLCIGAVDSFGVRASFSSIGPSADGRIKPDVMAMGHQVALMGRGGKVRKTFGTSYAAPQIAGLAACLIQAHPDRSNMDIIQAIKESSKKYTSPDDKSGYGIAFGETAHLILTKLDSIWDLKSSDPKITAKQESGEKTLNFTRTTPVQIDKISLSNLRTGEIHQFSPKKTRKKMPKINVSEFAKGFWSLDIQFNRNQRETSYLIIQ